jgi:hypothetical protein
LNNEPKTCDDQPVVDVGADGMQLAPIPAPAPQKPPVVEVTADGEQAQSDKEEGK